MRILIDSREQVPFTFEHERYAGTSVEAGPLDTGDYSLAGLADRVAVERKSLPDLVACLSQGRERFERELQRAAALDAFAVVVEASWADLAGGRAGAEYACWGFLRQYLESARKRWGSIVRAHGGEDAA